MIAIKGARVWTLGPQGTLEDGTILIENGRVKATGTHLEIPVDATIMDATGLTVVPGFVDAHSHLGLSIQGLGAEDANEQTEQIGPQLNVLDALDPVHPTLKMSLEGGVTTSAMLPGAAMSFAQIVENITVMPGMASVLKVRATYPEVLREKAGIKMALGDQPKRAVEEKKTSPTTRMSIMAMIRENLRAAQVYAGRRAKGDGGGIGGDLGGGIGGGVGDVGVVGSGSEAKDAKKEALVGLLERRYPAHIHAHRVRDIRLALELKKEFGFDLVLHHATEGYLMADEIAAAGVPCAVGPLPFARRGSELARLSLSNPAELVRAGVKVALISDFPTFPGHYLPIHAGMAHREGLPYEEALRSVTINAAEILGVAGRVGSLEAGKDADLVAFAGDPLGAMSRVKLVVASGEVVLDRTSGVAAAGKGGRA